jgi:Flp pilus assembly pilin Flp
LYFDQSQRGSFFAHSVVRTSPPGVPHFAKEVNDMTNLFANLQNAWFNLNNREEGQTMAEYALVLALIAAVTAAVFLTLGGAIQDKLTAITDVVTGP